jgi:hypothetical protein
MRSYAAVRYLPFDFRFALAERKTKDSRKGKHHAAAGKIAFESTTA